MRLCIVSSEYPPYPAGGIATYTEALANVLARAGHEVHVVTNDAGFGVADASVGTGVHRLGALTVHRLRLFDERTRLHADATLAGVSPFGASPSSAVDWALDPSTISAWCCACYVRSLHRSIAFDLVEVADMFAEGYFLARWRRAGRTADSPPVLVVGHTSSRTTWHLAADPWLLGDSQLRRRMLREEDVLAAADGLQACSRSLLSIYEHELADALPAVRAFVPNFLELPAAGGALAATIADGPCVLAVGRLEPRKGTDVLLQAFASLAAREPRLRLVLVGGTDHWRGGRPFESVLAVLPAEVRARVVCTGCRSRADVIAAVRAATVFVHAARWDNWPAAVLEAMSLGAACVVSAAGGQAEMVEHGVSGLVVPAGDAASLATAIAGLLDDEPARLRLGRAARTRAAQLCDPGPLLARKLSLAQQVIAGVRPPPPPPAIACVVDARNASDEHVRATCEVLARSATVGECWVCDGNAPAGWNTSHARQPPWLRPGAPEHVAWFVAGAVPDDEALGELRTLLTAMPRAAGTFAWLRPRPGSPFPWLPDLCLDDLLLCGAVLPSCLVLRRRDLQASQHLLGAMDCAARIAVLAAAACASTGGRLFHIGRPAGELSVPALTVTEHVQRFAVGHLDLTGLSRDETLWRGRAP